jgi:hypothetical protein
VILRFLILALAIVLAAAASVSAQTCTTTTADLQITTIQTAVDAASAGDVVCLPAGDVTWTAASGVNIDRSFNITLKGAGIGQTIIRDNISNRTSGYLFRYVTSGDAHIARLTGLDLRNGTGTTATATFAALRISGTTNSFRLDNSRFENIAGISGVFTGCVYGVVDNITRTTDSFNNGFQVQHPTCNGGTNGNGHWELGDLPGSASALYFENNTFAKTTSGATGFVNDALNGARMVWRYNQFDHEAIQGHGTESNQHQRGMRWVESYGNTFADTIGTLDTAHYFRSGTGVIYNNAIAGTYSSIGSLHNERDTDRFVPWGRVALAAGALTRSGTTATAVVVAGPTGAGWSINIAGADQSEYNGNKSTTSGTTPTALQYTVTGTPASPATGTILITGVSGACDGVSPYDSTNGTIYFSGTHDGANVTTGVLTDSGASFSGLTTAYSIINTTKRWSSTIASSSSTEITAKASGFEQSRAWDTGDAYEVRLAYPCLDQIGRGQGDAASGVPLTPIAWPNQALSPLYQWGNTKGGASNPTLSSSSSRVVADRDYYNNVERSYGAYTYPHPLTCGNLDETACYQRRPSSVSGASWR